MAAARAEGCLFGRKFSAVPLDRWRALVLGDEKVPDAEAPAEETNVQVDKQELEGMKGWIQDNFRERMQLRRTLIELADTSASL